MERRCMYFARTRAGIDARKRYAERSSAKRDDPVRNFLIAFFHFCARRNRTKYGYDLADRLSSEVWKDASGTSVYAFSYNYDLAGNRLAGSVLGEPTYWTYNAAGAVTLRKDNSGYSYYYYDTDGNLSLLQAPAGVVTYFEHGAHGLVTKIKPLGGTEVDFTYDALLRRVRMDQGAVHTYFRHDGIDLLEIADTSGNLTKLTHGYKVIDGIGSVIEIEKNGARYYLHQDHRGTTYKITDSVGAVVYTGLCDAWGKAIAESGSNPSIFWYQGEAWWKVMVNGRLYYITPTRIYDVKDAIFTQKDVAKPLHVDRRYGRLNPANAVDPKGTSAVSEPSGCYCDLSLAESAINIGTFKRMRIRPGASMLGSPWESTPTMNWEQPTLPGETAFRIDATASRSMEQMTNIMNRVANSIEEPQCCMWAAWFGTLNPDQASVMKEPVLGEEIKIFRVVDGGRAAEAHNTYDTPVAISFGKYGKTAPHSYGGASLDFSDLHEGQNSLWTAYHQRFWHTLIRNTAWLVKVGYQGISSVYDLMELRTWKKPNVDLVLDIVLPYTVVVVDACQDGSQSRKQPSAKDPVHVLENYRGELTLSLTVTDKVLDDLIKKPENPPALNLLSAAPPV